MPAISPRRRRPLGANESGNLDAIAAMLDRHDAAQASKLVVACYTLQLATRSANFDANSGHHFNEHRARVRLRRARGTPCRHFSDARDSEIPDCRRASPYSRGYRRNDV